MTQLVLCAQKAKIDHLTMRKNSDLQGICGDPAVYWEALIDQLKFFFSDLMTGG